MFIWSKILKAKIISAILVFSILTCWFLVSKGATLWHMEEGSKSSRFSTLERVIIASNNGYHYQLETGKPMEFAWEDPGLGFLTVTWGFFKRFLGLGQLDPFSDPFIIEYFVILLVFGLLFNNFFFKLPQWFYIGLPMLVLLLVLPWGKLISLFLNINIKFQSKAIASSEINHGILYLSIMTHWAKILGAVWMTAVTLQVALCYRSFRNCEVNNFITFKICIRMIAYGFVLGLIASIRKDTLALGVLAITAISLFCILNELLRPSIRISWMRFKVFVLMGCIVILAIIGSQIYRGFMSVTWMVRNHIYEMDDHTVIYGHPTWHVLYMSLGYVPNELGIKWNDEVGWKHVQKSLGNNSVQYATVEHEKASRSLFLKTIKEHPDLVIRNIFAKIRALFGNKMIFILMIFACASLIFIISLDKSNWWICGLFLSNMLVYTTIPIFIHPSIQFCLDFITSGFWIISVALILGGIKAINRFSQMRM